MFFFRSVVSYTVFVCSFLNINFSKAFSYDTNGYVVYCPCMGRFGNQADHFLGVLAFSNSLNRTLVLPTWIEYRYGEPKSIQVPFDTYFKVDLISEYHRIITMNDFMKNIAPKIWPLNKRISFCYTERIGEEMKSCNAKSGNPFGPFWDNFKIDFIGSEFYGPLNYDTLDRKIMDKWKYLYPSDEWPVLAFTVLISMMYTPIHACPLPATGRSVSKQISPRKKRRKGPLLGAPASFPVQKENVYLQKYLKWSDVISNRSTQFIKEKMSGGGFIGIHLRNGQDWVKACQHVHDSPTLFSAPQCVGYKNEKGPLTISMCLPRKSDIIKQLKRAIKKLSGIKYIYVASDSNHMIEDLNTALQRSEISAVRLQPSNPHLDLAIMGQANYFIGNCVSSYSAFVKRERDVNGLPSEFWSYPHRKKSKHEEL